MSTNRTIKKRMNIYLKPESATLAKVTAAKLGMSVSRMLEGLIIGAATAHEMEEGKK